MRCNVPLKIESLGICNLSMTLFVEVDNELMIYEFMSDDIFLNSVYLFLVVPSFRYIFYLSVAIERIKKGLILSSWSVVRISKVSTIQFNYE